MANQEFDSEAVVKKSTWHCPLDGTELVDDCLGILYCQECDTEFLPSVQGETELLSSLTWSSDSESRSVRDIWDRLREICYGTEDGIDPDKELGSDEFGELLNELRPLLIGNLRKFDSDQFERKSENGNDN